MLDVVLHIAQTENGRKLFFEILEYTRTKDEELAKKYWNLYDNIEEQLEGKYFADTQP